MGSEEATITQRGARRMLELLDKPEKWTQGAYARDARGTSIDSREPLAVCFCMLGAASRARQDLGIPYGAWTIDRAMARAVSGRRPDLAVSQFNDSATYDEVIEVLEELAA